MVELVLDQRCLKGAGVQTTGRGGQGQGQGNAMRVFVTTAQASCWLERASDLTSGPAPITPESIACLRTPPQAVPRVKSAFM